ncbi:MAG: thioesterase [Limnobacter sp. CACIAM 66H1]|uniref:thioesterase family protein n=1 Tax=Limnobacter sp. CACIAM 66H1 TaxID=1813033 RepID=UPI0007A8509C|nr:thioesterase family protein [Limnobacter sp. CACIAM 66H1]KYP11866.1 MAG: thioesterase [Limnobacter sp. CACIAM 66H1]
MARLQLDFPDENFVFSTTLTVRITDINAGNHLANDSMISMISEARARFLFQMGVPELSEDKTGIIVTDLATMYRSEAHARDQLLFEVGLMDFNKYGCDIVFRITRPADGRLISLAKSGFVFFNYNLSKVVPMPNQVLTTFEQALANQQNRKNQKENNQ